jgi:predicted ATP-grasp superfamily ATP-dependent carboligase
MPSARPGALVLGSDFKALGAVRSLARHGVPTVLVDNLPRAAWFSRHVSKRVRWRGEMASDAFVDHLLALGGRHELDGWVLLPTQDDTVEAVSRWSERLRTRYRTATPDWDLLERVHDKRQMNAIADAAGIARPMTWAPREERDLAGLDVCFPAIVKPATSIGLQHVLGRKALPAADHAELRSQYRRAVDAIGAGGLMIQEIVPGGGDRQFSIATFCDDGRMLAAMTARRLRQFPIDYGLSSSFVEAEEFPELLPLAERLLAGTGLSGPVEVEFKQDPRDGRYKLLDINVRLWAWHTLCTDCGLDFALMQYEAALGLPLSSPGRPRYDRRWVRMPTDVPAMIQGRRAGLISAVGWLRSLRRPLSFSVWDWRDPMPALGDAAIIGLRVLGGVGKRIRGLASARAGGHPVPRLSK